MNLFERKNNVVTLLVFFVMTLSCAQASSNQGKNFPVDAGNDFSVLELTEATTQASIIKQAKITHMFWRQTGGSPVDIKQPLSSVLTFTAPSVPDGETEHSLTFDFIAVDSKGNRARDSIAILITKATLPIKAEAGSNQKVSSSTNVKLQGYSRYGTEGIVKTLWQHKSGPEIDIINPFAATLSFIAPNVDAPETISLTFTITNKFGQSHSDDVDILVTPEAEAISSHILLFTEARIAKIRQKISEDDTAWLALTNKIAHYYKKVPYNAGEYAGAFALAYYVSGETKYIKRAIELLNHAYFDEPDIGWKSYSSRNSFRFNARWALMGYGWIKDFISVEEQARIENILQIWGEYWLDHVDFQNDYKSLRIADTDNITSLAENLTLLGYALSDSSQHANLSQQLLSAGDTLLNRFVVNYYMKDIMAGGAWAEGSDYSPNTQRHWVNIFMINKDQRDISYPINYPHDALQALIHQTLADYSGIYKYGSEEAATDYEPLSGDYRYEFALALLGLLESEQDLSLLHQWFNTLIKREGFKEGSMATHFQRLLFHDPLFNIDLPAYPTSTLNISPGVGLVSARTNWGEDSTNLFFINRKLRVDHEHKDALSFDIAFQGKWISKESTGYSGAATTSTAHNTILIENATADGSSSPTYRPAGDPSFYEIFDDNNVTIISAEATNTYNMSGYFATNYAKQVNRQIVFIKPSTVIVYDHIVTDKSKIKDLLQYSPLSLTTGEDHTRWVKIIQHMQAKPTQINSSHLNAYQVIDSGNKLAYQVHWPLDAKINVIDEAILWRDSLEYQMPKNQRKWHFEVTNQDAVENNEFITSLNFGRNIDGADYVINPIIMSKENGFILRGDVRGVALHVNNKPFIILFSQAPQLSNTTVDYIKPQGFEFAKVYSVGFDLTN